MRSYILFGAVGRWPSPSAMGRRRARALSGTARRRERGAGIAVLALRLTKRNTPRPASLDRLAHEFRTERPSGGCLGRAAAGTRSRSRSDDAGARGSWRRAARPVTWRADGDRRFLQLAIGIAAALGQVHQRGLVHKDVKPAHILVDWRRRTGAPDRVWHRLAPARERQAPGPPEFIAGTLAYMAPEQTGRMNRSIDSRSDLYSLGVIFYQMLTGVVAVHRIRSHGVGPLPHCADAGPAARAGERLSPTRSRTSS